MDVLLAPTQLGQIRLQNRIVMAPMTRSRATPDDDRPTDLHRIYYGQRASAGLIVTEGTHPSPDAKGYCRSPGIYSPEQVTSWRAVTDAVHAAGASIVLQLMHVGRIASSHNKRPGTRTVAPSPIRAAGFMFTDTAGKVPFDEPQALLTSEIPQVVAEYRAAALNARAAGFDGVELHCASGYLPMQFLSTGTNQRTDHYGGDVTGRIRFVIEVLEALVSAMGPGRVGLRIHPGSTYNDISDQDPIQTYSVLLRAATPLQLAYVHSIRSPGFDTLGLVRQNFGGAVIGNDGFNPASARAALTNRQADAISFGRAFIGNPDLVERIASGVPLAGFSTRTLYTPGPQGYIDYPTLQASNTVGAAT